MLGLAVPAAMWLLTRILGAGRAATIVGSAWFGPGLVASVVATLAGAGWVALKVHDMGVTRTATRAANQACNAHILVANSKVIRDSLAKAAASEEAASAARAELATLTNRARELGEANIEMYRKLGGAGRAASDQVALPVDLLERALSGR